MVRTKFRDLAPILTSRGASLAGEGLQSMCSESLGVWQ